MSSGDDGSDQLKAHTSRALLGYTCEERPHPVVSRRVERPNAIGAEDAIDVVIARVDGRDRKHRAKRRRYLADPGGDARPERGAVDERRFSDSDEIRFCLRSIRNYAPWVRTGSTRMAHISHLEAVVDKVPDAMDYLAKATGPATTFETPARDPHVSRLLSWRRR